MTITRDNALRGHTSEETAYLVNDYPYGFRLRTEIRYWLETTKHGDRFVSQTLNPKTGRWNKPKKSTYSLIGAMYLDDESHVTWTGVSHYTDDDALAAFLDAAGELSESQKDRLAEIVGGKKAMEGVTYTVREGAPTPEENAEQARAQRIIASRIARETRAAREEMR